MTDPQGPSPSDVDDVEPHPCPRCAAEPGSPCRSRGGADAGSYHTGRFTKVPRLSATGADPGRPRLGAAVAARHPAPGRPSGHSTMRPAATPPSWPPDSAPPRRGPPGSDIGGRNVFR
ncbi:zinc finger domain-containing protein [Streptomyces sp. NBC_00322]|uniref:zinc finger domain-containing protein n=1 Tax=Streptomyces sp. NBC_00322 TaxID=2975712 RepID=UPI003FA6FC04